MVLDDLAPAESVPLNDIVSARDSYQRKNLPPIIGSPDLVSRHFRWRSDTVMSAEKLENQLGRFTQKHPELHLDPKRILRTLEQATTDAAKDFDLIYGNQKDKPNYHYDRHTTITAAQGTKLLLGGLAKLYENPRFKEFIDTNPGKLQELIDIGIFVIARHEQDDWWSRRSVDAIKKNPVDVVWDANQAEVRKRIGATCANIGISREDFSRMLVLDTFTDPLETSLNIAVGAERLKEPYFPDGSGVPEFAWLGKDPEVRDMFLTLLGETARSADFMQLFNPNYYRKALLIGPTLPMTGVLSNVGAVALAVEYLKFRPAAAKFFGWLHEDGSINWQVIGVGKKFIKDFALKNLKLGVAHLQNFDEHEGNNVADIVVALEDAVA